MSVLQQACVLANEDFLNSIPDILPEPEFSKKYIRKINKLKNKMRNDRYHQFTTGTVKVMLVAAIIMSLILTAFAIPTTREYIITQFEKYSVFQAASTEDTQAVTDLTVGYIPDGFELVEIHRDEQVVVYEFGAKSGDWFVIEKSKNVTGVGFDTEKYECKIKLIDGKEYVLYSDFTDNDGVVWYDSVYIYKTTGTIESDELLKVAENLK